MRHLYLFCASEPIFQKSEEEIQRDIGMGKEEFLFYLSYWVEKKVLSAEEAKNAVSAAKNAGTKHKFLSSDELPDYPPSYIEKNLTSDDGVRFLYEKSQQILGKMLSPSDFNKIYGFHDFLGIEIDAVLLLLEFCA